MIIEYNKHPQSQEIRNKSNKGFVGNSFQFVQEYFTAGEQLVIGALMTYKDYKEIYPSQPTLAIKAGMSKRTVSSAIKKAKQYQLIYVQQRMNDSLKYVLSAINVSDEVNG